MNTSEAQSKVIPNFWHLSSNDILHSLQSNANNGLSHEEAQQRLKQYATSSLKGKRHASPFKLFLSQFNNPLIFLLLFCAALSLMLYDNIDAVIIFGIIVISALLTFFQEKSAFEAVDKLLQLVQIKATVLRNQTKKEIPIEEVVPGDILYLSAGDVIPGDCYILESKNLFVDEATLTGETFYAEKSPGIIDEEAAIAQRTNTLFMSTHVASGIATAIVVLIGKDTEFGKISGRLAIKPPETEFENGIRHFGYFLMQVTFLLLLVILGFNLYFGRPLIESLLFSLALAVGLTPQLLPAIVSINLAHGAKKMADKHVIVKKLTSIENFGSMNVLCCDKTGTLTSGVIQLKNGCGIDGNKSEKVLLYAYLNASFQTGYTNPIDQAIAQGVTVDASNWTKLDETPYDFNRKRISILAKHQNDSFVITKGAYQQVINICTQAEDSSGNIVDIHTVSNVLQQHFITFSNQGFRVLGLAYRNEDHISKLGPDDENQMIFLGFLLFLDVPKKGIDQTVTHLADLGIHLKIITGDNQMMAMHLAQLLNISKENVLTGQAIQQMSDQALIHQANRKVIFAEIEPNQKERLILALRKSGNVVGYLGDGINDVTALHSADVSISVDTAADAAKEVADIVLLKNDLSVLQDGVLIGRMTFVNTLKYVFMATSANFGNMFSMAGASLFLPFLPLLPKQVLLTNIMEDFPEMAIATDYVDSERVQKPLRWNIDFIRKFMVVFGCISSIFDFATFGMLLLLKASVEEFRTGWFVESVVSAAFIVLIVRTFRPFYKSRPSWYLIGSVSFIIMLTFLLPFTPIAPLLGFTPLSGQFYFFILGVIILYMLCVEWAKKIFLKRWNTL